MGKKKKPKAPAIDLTPIWNTYRQQRDNLTGQRDQMYATKRSEMAAGGLERGSEGWNQGLGQVAQDFEGKLAKLGQDAYYDPIRGQGDFNAWGDAAKAQADALKSSASANAEKKRPESKGASALLGADENSPAAQMLQPVDEEELWRA